MRYKVGEKVVLRDDIFIPHYVDNPVKISMVIPSKEIPYMAKASDQSERYLHFREDQIDHEKTVELHKQNTLNRYVDELERVVAAKNEIHHNGAAQTERTTSKFDRHKELTDYMHQTYIRKNKDYGDSFEQTHNKYGAIAGLVRIADKFHRLENIILNDHKTQVDDESIIDTLIDMSNYGLLLAMELEGEDE